MSRVLDHLYIFAMVGFTVYSQMIMRWRVSLAGPVPADMMGKVEFIARLLLNPWVISGIAATFLAGVSWILALTRFEVSYAYPWTGLNFLLVLVLGVCLFHETMSPGKLAGTLLVVAGFVVIARS